MAWNPTQVSPAWDVTLTGAVDLGLTAAGTRWYISIENDFCIRQAGRAKSVKIPVGNADAGWTEFYLIIWRKSGSVYNRVAISQNLRSQITASDTVTTCTLSPGIDVLEGDYVGYSITTTGATGYQLYSAGPLLAPTYYTDVEPGASSYDWSAQSSVLYSPKIGVLVRLPPQLAEIGDSIISGSPAHASYVTASSTVSVGSTIGFKVAALLGVPHQNWGIGGQTTATLAARIGNITTLLPRWAILEGGVNDLGAGDVTESQFLANWTTMLDDMGDIVPVVIPILPWTNGTTTQNQTRDTWNLALQDLVAQYSGSVWADCSEAVGQFRVGGDAGNLWDIQAPYDSDGTHFTEAGHAAIAGVIYGLIGG